MDDGVTDFTFVRHGESEANIAGIFQGHLDSPLSANGLRQADAVASALQEEHFDLIFASDLKRAAETARRIAAANCAGAPEITFTAQLREWNCGSFEGIRWEEAWRRIPDKLENAFYRERGEVAFDGGENKTAFQSRIDAFLHHCLALHGGKRILVVSHGGVLQRILRTVSGTCAPENLIPLAGNASISSFRYVGRRQAWQLTSWNCREHLKSLPQHPTLAL